MPKSKIVELAEKLETGEISRNDKTVKKAEQALASMFKTETGREELAEVVKIALQDAYNEFDISPRLFDTKHFKYGDNPLFKTKKKGIRAYWAAPNSYIPESRNYETEITMQFESLGVRPEASISELKTGRLDSFASLIKDGRDAISREIYRKVYTVIAQAYNATSNKDNYFATNSLSAGTLDKAINRVRKQNGGMPTIIADYDLCTEIETFPNFKTLEWSTKEINDNGVLGKYRGCPILYLPEILDPVTQKSIVPTNKMFVVGKKIGYAASYGDIDTMQEQNINDKSWNCRVDQELGYVVTEPKGIALIEITA